MDRQSLIKLMNDIKYPGNQYFDIDTFEPRGEAINRVEYAKQNMPELLLGGESLLDIGCSKGFICFYYRKLYKKIVGYEIYKDAFDFCNGLKEYHNIDNISFINGEMRDILFGKTTCLEVNDKIELEKINKNYLIYHNAFVEKFDVVYCGSVHHHFFKDAILYGAPFFLYLKKLIGLCKNILILDGPFDMNDGSLKVFAKEGNWTNEHMKMFTLENHIKNLKPQFELIRLSNNERNRYTAVFKRVNPDIEYIEYEEVEKMIKKDGVIVECNSARPKGSMYRIKNKRIKFDKGLQTDGVYFVLNSLPQFFAKTISVIIKNGERIGDISEWIDGSFDEDIEKFYRQFIMINCALSSIGMIEPHFKITDYKFKNGSLIDVDVDMIRHFVDHTDNYINNWYNTKKEFYPEREPEFRFIKNNWKSKTLYYELSKKIL